MGCGARPRDQKTPEKSGVWAGGHGRKGLDRTSLIAKEYSAKSDTDSFVQLSEEKFLCHRVDHVSPRCGFDASKFVYMSLFEVVLGAKQSKLL